LSGHASPYPRLDIEIKVDDDLPIQLHLIKYAYLGDLFFTFAKPTTIVGKLRDNSSQNGHISATKQCR